MNALLIYPTHENLREVEEPLVNAGIDARTYPARTTEDTKHYLQNCWNDDANVAESIGFAVVKAVCPTCKSRAKCVDGGYLRQLADVKGAQVTLCTHKRVEFSDFADLMAGRDLAMVHENPVDILRPRSEASDADLFQMQMVLNRLLCDPECLDWFGDDRRVDDDGNRYHDEELRVRKDRQYTFIHHLSTMLDGLVRTVEKAVSNTEWKPGLALKRPSGIERTLYRASRLVKASFFGQPWRFLLAASAGELTSSAILVTQRFRKGCRGEADVAKSAIGFRDNRPLLSATTWFNDATLGAEVLSNILGAEVWDKTPGGRLELQKKAVQILRDITRTTAVKSFANLIRGILVERPQFNRVGLICHQTHLTAIDLLEPEFKSRIVKRAYFGSGDDRSSNSWHEVCDVIIVAGTPRVPPAAIAAYLIQVRNAGAACRKATWGPVRWDGFTESGEPITGTGRGYLDEDWRRAHRDLVRATIIQAVGRGRGILENGCEVIVLSTEECGLLVSDAAPQSLNDSGASILVAIRKLTTVNSNILILENTVVSTSEIAEAVKLGESRTRELLRDLESRGHVIRVGTRGGWRLASPPEFAVPDPTHRSPLSVPAEGFGPCVRNGPGSG